MPHDIPPTAELFTLKALTQRHPTLLPEHRLRWAARNRETNGLKATGAVYDSPTGELLWHEPRVIAWLLGLAGRAKPRAARRSRVAA